MYRHTQTSPWQRLFFIVPAMFFSIAFFLRNDTMLLSLMLIVGTAMLIIAFSFQELTISDEGDHLNVRFGPLPIFGSRIKYEDITAVERNRTMVMDGWGIHYIPFRGWTLNLFGFECVKITRGHRVLRVGTNDSANLTQLIESRIRHEA